MMRKPASMKGLEELGRIRLSENFFLRDFLHSEIAAFYGLRNIPDDPDLAIAAGRRLCEDLLEPLQATFGRLAIRSAIARRRSTPSATNTASTAPPTKPMPPATSGTCGTPRAAWAPRPAWSCPGWRIVFAKRATGGGSPGGSTITCPMRASKSSRNSGRSTSLGTSAPGASFRASPPRAASSRDRAWQTTKAAMRRTMRAFRRPPRRLGRGPLIGTAGAPDRWSCQKAGRQRAQSSKSGHADARTRQHLPVACKSVRPGR